MPNASIKFCVYSKRLLSCQIYYCTVSLVSLASQTLHAVKGWLARLSLVSRPLKKAMSGWGARLVED